MSTDRPTAGLTGPRTEPPADHVEHESNMLVVVSIAVLVFVAVALALAALLVHLNASDLQARADRIERETKQHAAGTESATQDLTSLHAGVDHAYAALGGLTVAYQAQLASQNHAIDVANAAADSYNAGQINIGDALKTDAQAAVADAEAKSAAVRAALIQVKQAFSALRQASG
jgi:hypothetical protein